MLSQGAFWVLTRIPAVMLWTVGMLAMAGATWIVAMAYRIHPTGTPPNCWVHAAHIWTDAVRSGQRAYWVLRRSDLRPHWLIHAMVCRERDPDTGAMPLESFVPVGSDAVDVAWWEVHRWTAFRGRVVNDD